MDNETRYDRRLLAWAWILPIVYLLHIGEEYWGGGGYSAYMARVRGVQISPTRFLVLNGIGWGLMLLGLYLARRLRFLEWMVVCLGTVEAANGVSHSITAALTASYNPGVVSGLLLFIPLGLFAALRLRSGMSGGRYLTAVGVGIGIQLIVSLLAISGGRTHA